MMIKDSIASILLIAVLTLFYPSLGITSANEAIGELLGEKKITKKDVFSCPNTIEREKLLELLNAPSKTVPSKLGWGTPDLVAEPIEIKEGLWGAHKMPDTLRLLNLLNKDKEGLIQVLLSADESRPQGTMGADYDSVLGIYHFFKKSKPEDKGGLFLEDYSLIVTFYRKKP